MAGLHYHKRDKVLPSAFLQVGKEDRMNGMTNLSIKLTDFGPGQPFLSHPRPVRPSEAFFDSSSRFRKVYCYAKAVKKALSVDVSSFMLKKVLLSSNDVWKALEKGREPEKSTYFCIALLTCSATWM